MLEANAYRRTSSIIADADHNAATAPAARVEVPNLDGVALRAAHRRRRRHGGAAFRREGKKNTKLHKSGVVTAARALQKTL